MQCILVNDCDGTAVKLLRSLPLLIVSSTSSKYNLKPGYITMKRKTNVSYESV